MFKKIFPFLIVYFVVLILYYPVLSTFFSHDDFFHFKVSITDGSLKEFINFFGFHPFEQRQIAFYRPLFREVLYNLFYNIFGLNHLPFRILSFAIHFLNIYLVYVFIDKLFHKRMVSFMTSFFFAITTANVSPFYYLAGGIQTQGVTMFILLTLIFFTRYLKENKSKYKFWSFLTFLLALASHEQAVVLPLLLSGLIFIQYKFKDAVRKAIQLWPFILIVAVYGFLNVSVIGYSSAETQYNMIFNIKTIIQTIAWYAVWTLGIPETFIDFLLPGFRLNPSLMRYWGNFYRVIFPSFAAATLIILFIIFYLFLKHRKTFYDKKFLLLAAWFPLGILPVLFLPHHKSTHYLYPSLPAFWGAFSFLTFDAYHKMRPKNLNFSKILLIVLFISLTLLSSTSAILGRTTYWAATRGRLAEKLIGDVKQKYPTLPKGSAIYFTNDPSYPFISEDWGSTSKQASFALNGEDALQLSYNDPTLRVFYEDLGGVPENFPEEKIYLLVAGI